jgi:enoyl-CoA hydratase/carnithine racemase
MDFETIMLEKENRVAKITLNRPETRNALNLKLGQELCSAIKDIAADDESRAVVLTGVGTSFCSGLDFGYGAIKKGLPIEEASDALKVAMGGVKRGKLFHPLNEAILGLQRLGKPTIAMVNGPAIGAGFDLALTCDLRVGSENSSFMVGYTRVGLIPDCGSVWFLPRVVGIAKALELTYTADLLGAEEALRIGVLNKLVPAAELEKETMALAQKIANGPPIANRLSKMLSYQMLGMDLESALAYLAAMVTLPMASEDFLEAVKAFVEKRSPVFKDK